MRLYRPLIEKIMADPVVDVAGESFERSAVTARCSKKGEKVAGATYYPNRALKRLLNES
jgi:hypothetical protein